MRTRKNNAVAWGLRALTEGFGDPMPRGLPVGPRRMWGGSAEGGYMTGDEESVFDDLSKEVTRAAENAIRALVSSGMDEEEAVRWVSNRIEKLSYNLG